MLTLLATIVVLGVLIFVHELGHFITAKLVDIEVPRFSIGLGPKLWGFKHGETEYVISWLPLGGYVKMAGLEEMEQIEGGPVRREDGNETAMIWGEESRATAHPPRPRDFESKSLAARTLVISAGVLMNLFFAFAVYAVSALVWGVDPMPDARLYAVHAEHLPAGAEALADLPRDARVVQFGNREVEDWEDLQRAILLSPAGPTVVRFADAPAVSIRLPGADSLRGALAGALEPHREARLGWVSDGAPGAAAGLRAGDRIVSAGGQPVTTWRELVEAIQASPARPLVLEFEREGERRMVTVTPAADTIVREGADPRVVGFLGVGGPKDRPGFFGAIAYGFDRTWGLAVVIVQFLWNLITGEASPRSLGGPIAIGQITGQVVRLGLEQFLGFMAMFSVNLAVLNLLPIPVLDGGHLLFLGIEAVRGRALSVEQRMRLSQVGFVIILAIMAWAIGNDVLGLFGL